MNHKDIAALIKRMSGHANILTIPRLYIDLLDGDHVAALFLSQCVYWTSRSQRQDGFFYKSGMDWLEELGLSPYQVRRSRRKIGIKLTGVLKTKLRMARGAPTLHFRIDTLKLAETIVEFLDSEETSQTDSEETSQTDSEETQQSLTETTSETTERLPSRRYDPPSKKEKVRQLEIIEEAFAEERGCWLPDWSTDKSARAANRTWRSPAREILKSAGGDLDLAVEGTQAVTRDMKSRKLTFTAPVQIVESFRSWIIDRETRSESGPAPSWQKGRPESYDEQQVESMRSQVESARSQT